MRPLPLSYGDLALSAYAAVLALSLLLLAAKRQYPLRRQGIRSGAGMLAFVLACLAGGCQVPIAKALDWLRSPEEVFLAKACVVACFLTWFVRLYGYVLLFVIVSSAAPRFPVRVEAPPRWWWAVPVGYLLLSLVLAVGLRI